jgi:hypothetical protein
MDRQNGYEFQKTLMCFLYCSNYEIDTHRKNDVFPAPELPNTIAFIATGLLANKG